jgi:hypothetical protein
LKQQQSLETREERGGKFPAIFYEKWSDHTQPLKGVKRKALEIRPIPGKTSMKISEGIEVQFYIL